ncbi:MAG: type 4a pilus biogenesis protein PilO [Planctomycetia bacterium]|jgi:Tfp pilus assembly protein PilO|nr:type 4a pilus biogenesis protein PilO [Planctomycetia bacterium]
MKRRSQQTKKGKPQTWLITALLAAGAVAYVVFVFLPFQQNISTLRGQVQERRQQIMQAQSLAGTVAQARMRLVSAREVGNQWRADAPHLAQLTTHFASVTKQAEEAGVAIDRTDPLPAVELNLLAQQNVTIQFHAPFSAVFDLLHRLEALPGTLWVRDLRLHASTEGSNTLRGELTLTIFVDRTDYSN